MRDVTGSVSRAMCGLDLVGNGASVVSHCTPLRRHMPKTQSRDCATTNSPLSKALQLQATCLDLAAAHRNPEDVGSNSWQPDYRTVLFTASSKASACGYPSCTRAMRACYVRKGNNDSGATPVLSLTSAVTQASPSRASDSETRLSLGRLRIP